MSDVLARATVAVSADTSAFDTAMNLLPKKAQKAIAKSVDAINAEMAEVGKGISQARNLDEVQKLTAYYGQLKDKLEDVKRSAITQAASVGEVGKAFSANSNKLQVFAQGLDDLQYVPEQGLRPILNNLVQISPALGIAALVLNQFINHWDDLAKLLGQGATKTEAQAMEELGKKTEKTADETARLLKYEERRKALETQRDKPDAKKQVAANINEAIRESGEPAVRQAIEKAQGPAIKAAIPDEVQKALDRATTKAGAAHQQLAGAIADPNSSDFAKQRAAKGVANAEEQLDAAKKAWNDAYNQARDKIQGNLEADLVAFKAFVKDVEDKKLLPKAAIDKLKKAARTPQEIKDDDEQDRIDRENAQRQTARRLNQAQVKLDKEKNLDLLKNAVANLFQVELPGRAAAAQQKITADEKAAGVQAAGGLAGRLNPQLLKDVALGNTTNRELLATAIEGGMKRAGFKDPKQFSGEAANNLIANNEEAIRKRVLEAGGTREQAAQYLLAQNVERLKAEAEKNRPSYGVTDIEAYQRESQDALLRNGGQSEALLDAQKQAMEAYLEAKKALDENTAAIKAKNQGLVLK